MLLTVIKPPNNAEIAILRMKHDVYTKTGMLSAWALSPMVPIAVFDDVELSLSRKDLPQIPGQGLELTLIEEGMGQNYLTSAGLKNFCDIISDLFTHYKGFRKSFCGLHLFDSQDVAHVENRDDLDVTGLCRDLLNDLDDAVKCWHSCELEVYRTDERFFSVDGWWERVELEMLLSIRFQKARKH